MKQKIAAWMQGRYGADALSRFMLVVYLILSATQLFPLHTVVRLILQILSATLCVLIFFRLLSRNIPKRTAENTSYLACRRRIKEGVLLRRNRWRYRKTHVYRKCPHCGVQIKLPRVSGEHRCACPKCGDSFAVSIR
ncbi:MAG: hypothetical protein IJV98_08675 [Clostridia bacterium]|nr:hypothetical protein [Clostridia bacterium]